MKQSNKRIETIDFLRGSAVLIMLIANTSPYIFQLGNSIFLRYIFSLAAPVFIFLAGFTAQMNYERDKPVKLIRTLQILILAINIDFFIWKSYPLLTFDVLYLIGFSKLFLIITSRPNNLVYRYIYLATSVLIFIFIKYNIQYRFDIPDLSFNKLDINFSEFVSKNPIQRMFYDGWFPIFPWVIFFLIGSIFYSIKKMVSIKTSNILILASILLLISLGLNFTQIEVREKYLEVFYPLSGVKLLLPFSVSLLILGLISRFSNLKISFINLLGKYSLFAYLLNAVLIAILDHFEPERFIILFKIIALLSIIGIVLALVYLINFLKKSNWLQIPNFIKFILGL